MLSILCAALKNESFFSLIIDNSFKCMKYLYLELRSAVSFAVVIERQLQGYFWQAYVPSFLVSIFGALSVYIPSDIVPGRMVLSMTSFLSLIGLFGAIR